MNFAEDSKIWIYQSSRTFNNTEIAEIQKEIDAFTIEWTAHQKQLHAQGKLMHSLFVVLMVDESINDASGCSIDKSVRFIKQLEEKYKTNFFDRFRVAYRNKQDEIEHCSKEDFEQLIATGVVTPTTIVFNNLIHQYSDLTNKWEVPLEQSWHQRIFY